MLEYLTGAYNRDDIQQAESGLPPQTNIGRLFGTFAWGLEIIHDHAERIRLWDDIDKARGAVLDRHGQNFGVARSGASDAFYRLLIKVKMIALLSGGDIDTVINAASSLFDVEPENLTLEELFPAKVWIYVDEKELDAEHLEMAPLIAELMKRIIAAGVGMRIILRARREGSAEIFVSSVAGAGSSIIAKPREEPHKYGTGAIYAGAVGSRGVSIEARPRADPPRRGAAALYACAAAYETVTITARPCP